MCTRWPFLPKTCKHSWEKNTCQTANNRWLTHSLQKTINEFFLGWRVANVKFLKVILYSYLILKKFNERITDS